MHAPTVSIAEDDTNYRRVLDFQLTEAGYSTTLAENGNEELEQFLKLGHQVVLTDLKMPGIGGEELLKKIKQASPHTPVIIIPAYGVIRSAEAAVQLGAFQYLTKPVDSDELLHTIRNALNDRNSHA